MVQVVSKVARRILCLMVLGTQVAKAAESRAIDNDIDHVYTRVFGMMDLSRPELALVKKHLDAGEKSQAMIEYRGVLARRFTRLPWARYSYGLHNPADADKLLEGQLLTARYGDSTVVYSIPIGKPGSINFFQLIPEYNLAARDISNLNWINKHLELYAKTKNPKYLQAWVETWNDYNLHWDEQLAKAKKDPALFGKGPDGQPRIVGMGWVEGQTLMLLHRMSTQETGLVGALQWASKHGGLDLITPDAMARLLDRLLTREVASTRKVLQHMIKYPDNSGVPNQGRSLSGVALTTGLLFPDFPEMTAMLREAIPATGVSNLPDGTDREQSLNYFSNTFAHMLGQFKLYVPAGEQDKSFQKELEDLSAYRERFVPSIVRPDGYQPATGSDGVWSTYGKTKKLQPPSTAFTSIFFPYGGYAVERDGWTPESLYLFMKVFRPSTGHWRAIDGALQLSAFGRNLLVSPVGNLYEAKDAPWRNYWEHASSQNTICVDGKSALQRTGNSKELDAMRWHTSEHFDFMETQITGPFSGVDFHLNTGLKSQVSSTAPAKDPAAVYDVTFRREVHFLREAGCWIVTDRLNAANPHQFTQSWNFGPEFSENQVQIDTVNKSIITNQPDGPNLSIFQFGGPRVTFEHYFGLRNAHQIAGWVGIVQDKEKWIYTPAMSVHVNWQGHGRHLLVSLLVPHRGAKTPFLSLADKSTSMAQGFAATLSDGRQISYLAAASPSILESGGVSAHAESLLVMRDAQGRQNGVVMGAKRFNAHPTEMADFEFASSADHPIRSTPITAPTGFRWEGSDQTLVPRYPSLWIVPQE